MNEEVTKSGRDRSSLGTGIVLIILGSLFLMAQLDLADFGDLFEDYWPMIVVLVGIPKLFSRETVWGGLWLLTVGAWLQISHLRLFGLSWATSWPLLLIALGAGLMLRSFFDPSPRKREETHGS